MSNVITTTDLTQLVLNELVPWDASYDIEAIALELNDSYRLVGPAAEARFEDIPEDEFTEVCRTYDRNYV